ncbi:MAG: nucleotidyltransferase family protein, partial [Bacteroidales bacterium]|nr:nucleotidyltransferase family protein [Bacteroidales bacterium]
LPYMGMTIIEKVIENVTASSVDETVVVVGCDREKVLEVIAGRPVMHIVNDNYKSGMLSSVKCGISSLPADFRAVLVFPGDQPMTEAPVIDLVINAYRNSGKGIVIPVHENRRGHPILVDAKYRDEIMNLDDTEGLRVLAGKHPDDVAEAESDNPLILSDIDTMEDYMNELNKTFEIWKR